MAPTVTRRFRVEEITEDAIVWVTLLETSKKGLQFALPADSDHYPTQLKLRIDDLESGDVIEATVRSENERNTAWRFEDFSRIRPKRR